jgi:type IV secretory pathway VirJ component
VRRRRASAWLMAAEIVTLAVVARPFDSCRDAAEAATSEESIRVGRFGLVHLYHATARPQRVALFVSGDGGWNLGVIDMARELAGLDAVVAGIDITHYLKELRASEEPCVYPAADFEDLSKAIQMKLGYPQYIRPVLVGYSSGATLVYATLVQAPSTTFRGAISLGFCPDLPLDKPLCKGSGLEWSEGPKGKGVNFLPARTLEPPWIALQGTIDQVCDPAATEKYVKQVPGAEIVMLPKVGHGFSVPRNWMPQFRDAFARIANRAEADTTPAPAAAALPGLPLTEVAADGPPSRTMAVLYTGDGGYGVTDRGVARSLADHGIPVVAVNSLHYFWKRRTPEGATADLRRLLRHYLSFWKKDRAILVGYSLGADVLPFMLNRLPPELRGQIPVLALLGPSAEADFQFHLTDWLGGRHRKTSLPVRPELEKLRGLRILCFYGTGDKETICDELDQGLVTSVPMEGGHRIGGKYAPIAEAILKEAR